MGGYEALGKGSTSDPAGGGGGALVPWLGAPDRGTYPAGESGVLGSHETARETTLRQRQIMGGGAFVQGVWGQGGGGLEDLGSAVSLGRLRRAHREGSWSGARTLPTLKDKFGRSEPVDHSVAGAC